ncbi:MAG: ABC transporter ATP-binding protein [Promethearchaeota archaeon]
MEQNPNSRAWKEDSELVEESIFGENQFDDIIEWARARQGHELLVRVTGMWRDSGEFFKGRGLYLKKWDGSTFPNDIYVLLTEGDLGRDNILMGRRVIHFPKPKKKRAADDLELTPNTTVLENRFKRDLQDRVFFRADEDYRSALMWLESFVGKYQITVLVEGEFVSGHKKMRCTVTGLVKKVKDQEIFIELMDAFNPVDPLNEEYKEFLTKEWHVQIARKGTNQKIHPKYLLFEIGEELALTKKVLNVKDVKVTLGGRVIIHDVNFLLEKGEILGIIGESGAGKSTTLKAILGEFDFEGEIALFGYDARDTKTIAPFIGYIPQELSRMYANFNALENIVSFGRQYGLPDDILIQRGKKILKDLGISEFANQPVSSLSGGQQRRASIAISMVHNPRILFLDEPTSGLDPLVRYELWEYLDIINKEYGITLVVISHYLDEIEYCDKACIFLREVGFYDFGTPQGLKSKLPGGGLAVEVTLESVSIEAIKMLEDTEGVEFVIQRGERIRILSDLPTHEIVDNILETLEKNEIEIHSVEMKVEIDMIDYFTYVSEMQKAGKTTGERIGGGHAKLLNPDLNKVDELGPEHSNTLKEKKAKKAPKKNAKKAPKKNAKKAPKKNAKYPKK